MYLFGQIALGQPRWGCGHYVHPRLLPSACCVGYESSRATRWVPHSVHAETLRVLIMEQQSEGRVCAKCGEPLPADAKPLSALDEACRARLEHESATHKVVPNGKGMARVEVIDA